MLRFCFPQIVIGTDTQSPPRTVDPAQLELMFIDDGSMDGWLANVDVFGIFAQFAQHPTTASDAMLARMVPMLADRDIELAVSYGGLVGYGGTPNFISGLSTPTQQGTLAAANDLAVTGVYGVLAARGITPDWNIMDSPLDRVTLNGSNKSPHVAHHGFGSAGANTSVIYTAGTTGSAGNSITVAHVVAGNNTPLTVSAATVSVLVDAFGRTVSGGWDSPDTGPAYSYVGTLANFNVAAGVGTISVPTTGTTRIVFDATTIATARQRGRVLFSLDAVPVGGFFDVSVILRAVDSANFYDFRAHISTAGAIQAGIFKTVAGTSSQLVQSSALSGLTLAPGTQFWVEGKADGTTLSCTIWASGTAKPAASTSVTDSTYTAAGGAGVRAGTNSGSTSLPRIASFDSLRVDDIAQDGTAITVNLATGPGGAETSTAADVIAAVNLDPDASSLVTASGTAPSTGLGAAPVFAATNLAFGDDGVNLSNTDTATAIVAYIGAIHASLPDMLFGITADIRRPYNGVSGYSPNAYPAAQMPDFKDFWTIFWAQVATAGLTSVVRLVMFDTSPELQAALRDTGSASSHIDDWYARNLAQQSQIEANGVLYAQNMGYSDNSVSFLDSHNSVGPASEASYQAHLVQQPYDMAAYRILNQPTMSRSTAFVFMDFGYYPRVLLPVDGGLSQGDTYLKVLAGYRPDDYTGAGTGPVATASSPVPLAGAVATSPTATATAGVPAATGTAPVPVATATSPRPS